MSAPHRPPPVFPPPQPFEAPARRRRIPWLPWLLAGATVLTTLIAGVFLAPASSSALDCLLGDPGNAVAQLQDVGVAACLAWIRVVLGQALPYALAILAFFLAHEMGHYLACRYHGVDCTLPFFLPGPPPIGTFGAVIRIRSPFPHRRALFDIGIAGPLAGFVVMLPILVLGVLDLQAVPHIPPPPGSESITFGDSLLTAILTRVLRPEVGPAVDLLIAPLFVAGWFAMLATAMNLIPAGQFDGGHIFYALFPRWHRKVSLASGLALLMLVLAVSLLRRQFSAWTVWALIVLSLGRRHPPVPDDGIPLGAWRWTLAVVVLGVLVVCFIPHPIATISSP